MSKNKAPKPELTNADPFDPARQKLAQDFSSEFGVKPILSTVPVRKPNRHEFIRVRAGEEWRIQTGLFIDRILNDTYLVDRDMWIDLGEEITPALLFTAINRQNCVFLWPVNLPGPDGRRNLWNESAITAAGLAELQWVRVSANRTGGYYDTGRAMADHPDPEWPEDVAFKDMLRLAFSGRLIDAPDHPVIKRLRGLS